MQLVDSHCHLDRVAPSEPHTNLTEQLTHTQAQGVNWMLNISIDQSNWRAVTDIAEQHQHIFASIGIHPDSHDTASITQAELCQAAAHPKVIAIGETGLDYFHQEVLPADQQRSFRIHIQAAIETGLPLVIHTRDAREDTLRILQEESAEKIGGIMHCFTESLEMAEQAIAMGFYISLSGILTFKNAKSLREVAKAVPLEKLLIETDAPYLAPMPFRGKPNQPLYVRYVAEKLAEIKGCSVEEVATTTTQNFFNLFAEPLTRKGLL